MRLRGCTADTRVFRRLDIDNPSPLVAGEPVCSAC